MALETAEELRLLLVSRLRGGGIAGALVIVVVCAACAGLAAWITAKYAPEAAGSGIPHTKAVLLGLRPLRWLRVTATKFVAGFLALAAGLSLGREGPTVHIGASMGQALAEQLRIPRRSYKPLVASGAGAGLAAAFNAPLAGFIFVIEELARELTPTTYGAALIAAVAADVVTRIVMGQHPTLEVGAMSMPPLGLLPLVAILGIIAGFLGVAFNRLLLRTGNFMQRWNWRRAVAVGAVAGLVVWNVPSIAGGGHRTAEIFLSSNFSVGEGSVMLLLLLFAAKFGFTLLSYGAGVPGGVFAPMLVMGALLGAAFGLVCQAAFPAAGANPSVFAVVGMVALFAASVRAPLTGVVLILEMTSNFALLYALIVGSLTAYLVAEGFRDKPVYDALLENDLQKPAPPGAEEAPMLVELFIEPGSFLDHCQAGDIPLPDGVLVVSVLRGTNEFAPPSAFHIEAGDVVVFLVERDYSRLARVLASLAKM